eukprot:CAMPEP_0185032088 /NCGR_PEP_ID=MMETSP1103-20130426/19934_1 /TAXON_ID=36769 /ORGANISM="Paraphysomonas bandaiensis, Strain Caron Lab Isolate" /LENGTH=668 /DNA_ID=CAMNT_0027567849 /DNA_START=348 /DNA_END=2351 /DNA_ORIENTATION=+
MPSGDDMAKTFLSLALYPSIKLAIDLLPNGSGECLRPLIAVAESKVSLDKVNAKLKALEAAAPASTSVAPPQVVVDVRSDGVVNSLKNLFTAAIATALPILFQQPPSDDLTTAVEAVITRCGNPAHGDFQCNNSMKCTKALKSVSGYSGPKAPKDIAALIVAALPENSLIAKTSIAPNGFINIEVATAVLVESMADVVASGVKPPSVDRLKVLVDFSSPNIAKEMHVGHLRSTIIGDSICRMLEFCGHDVMRINHVGDWGTQFGMLITYLQEEYPDIVSNPPNISDLTAIYKAAKNRFDADEDFKTTSRNNVVKLQSGDTACRTIWNLLCDISRREFQRVYDALGVTLTEVGESFYNPMIPPALEELTQLGLTEMEEKMLISKLPHFDIPLILRKSDGGYGYDSTDMAAIKYRLHDLDRDWLVYITDAGQAGHFHKVFDVARAAKWTQKEQRLDHIGFGVVCSEDGKRFKSRSGDTVRLIDLLNEARDRMASSLEERVKEGKTDLTPEQIVEASTVIGYGAVKYFDLKQNCITNYIFSYDKMLDTRGDTAVYLMFAYARVASILRKGKEGDAEKNRVGFDPTQQSLESLMATVRCDHPSERQLAFELLQFGDVIRSAVKDLMPNRLCDYLKETSVKFTEFVTNCHVLNSEECHSRLILCEATRRVMEQ